MRELISSSQSASEDSEGSSGHALVTPEGDPVIQFTRTELVVAIDYRCDEDRKQVGDRV